MLYDHKRWDRTETKPDVFSLESLIAWLETMPADKTYCYLSNGSCLISQYLMEKGFERPAVYSDPMFSHGPQDARMQAVYPYLFNDIARDFNSGLPNSGRTFGGALARARKALSATSAHRSTQGE